jgi:hypothetical protein
MGLDVSHDAFSGAYSAFSRFRQVVAKAMGGSYPPHDDKELERHMWDWGDGFKEETHPGLFIFMMHSDCDGEITPEDCIKVAVELEQLLPEIKRISTSLEEWGHIARNGGVVEVTKQFIKGCRAAAAASEPLKFC